LGEFARDLWNPDESSECRVILMRGHEREDLRGKKLCARGIVMRKDKGFVMVSCGGLLWLFSSRKLARIMEIEDRVTILIE
jgi:hypothetical protein